MHDNNYIILGRYILLEYLRNPQTLNNRTFRKCALLAEDTADALSLSVDMDLKSKIDQILCRRYEWLQLCNGDIGGKINWKADELGLILDPDDNEIWSGVLRSVGGRDESLRWSEIVLYDLIGRSIL